MLTSYKKLDSKKIKCTAFAKTKTKSGTKPKSQDMAYFSIDKNGSNGQLHLQSPVIKLDAGGIPSANSPYHPTVRQQANGLKIPLEVNPNVDGESKDDLEKRSANLEIFKNSISSIDAEMEGERIKNMLFEGLTKTKIKKYEYLKCVKTPMVPDDDSDEEDEGESTGAGPPFYH